MELELEKCLRVLGPRARVACTPGFVADGERRFVEEEVGPGVMSAGDRVDGCVWPWVWEEAEGKTVVCTAVVRWGREKERKKEGATGGGCLGQKNKLENSKPSQEQGAVFPRD